MRRLAFFPKASKSDRDNCFADICDWWLLKLLVTDRPFRRRGAATTLVRQSIAEADRERISCEVEAKGMRPQLYKACGFRTLKTTTVQVQGQVESVQYEVMRRNPIIATAKMKKEADYSHR